MSEESTLNIEYVKRKQGGYRREISKAIHSPDGCTDQQLNKLINKYNRIMKQRYTRLKEKKLLPFSYSIQTFSEMIGQDCRNIDFSLLAPSKMTKFQKIRYLGELGQVIDKETMTVDGAKRVRDIVLSELQQSDLFIAKDKIMNNLNKKGIVIKRVENEWLWSPL